MSQSPASFSIAIRDGRLQELAAWFASNPNRVNDSDSVGEYPLETAARMLRLDLCEKLIDLGAKVDFVDASGNAPIHSAIEAFAQCEDELGSRAGLKIVELLLAHGANPNLRGYNDFSPLHLACVRGTTEIARLLLQRGASPTLVAEEFLDGGRTPLEIAQRYKHQAVIDLLLSVIPSGHLVARETQLRRIRNRRT